MRKNIKSIIIDDEDSSYSALELLLYTDFPEIDIIARAISVKEAVLLINKIKPELVFLDIMLPDGSGFDILDKLKFRDFQIIFTTAFSEYALQAFDFSALHYLLKPITQAPLKLAIDKFFNQKQNLNTSEQINVLLNYVGNKPDKIALPTNEGVEIFKLEEISRFESDSNYTRVIFKTGKSIVLTRTLTNFEQLLPKELFIRVHNRHIIAINEIVNLNKGRPLVVELSDGTTITIAERRREEFLKVIQKKILLLK